MSVARRPPPGLLLVAFFCLAAVCRAKVMRNNALMNKMMSQFQKDNGNSNNNNNNNKNVNPPPAEGEQPENIVSLMQGVLCRNFPTIPCALIVQDTTLGRLIRKSIQQINNKKQFLERTTQQYEYKTNFPAINSEDLSNFLQVQNTGYFENKEGDRTRSKQKQNVNKVSWSQENVKSSKMQKNVKRTSFYGRKKLKKFYPHKVKYKDKARNSNPEFREYSDEKLSMSVEVPEMTLGKQHQHYPYKREPADPSVWRIDYSKHGAASGNMLGSLTKTRANGVVEDTLLSQLRKDVLHPDVYIKKNYIRKNSELLD